MRKALILTIVLAGIGGLVAVAQASQDKVPAKDASQVTTQTESLRKDGEHAPRDEHSRETSERSRKEHREAREEKDDDDRD